MISTSTTARVRRFLGAAAALTLVLAVGACGDDDSETTSDDTEATTPDSGVIETVPVEIYFVDTEAFATGTEPYEVPVARDVPADDPIGGALIGLYLGPSEDETGLELVTSESTGATVSVADGVATVQLEGGCDSGGSTMTVANLIIPTMKQFDEVDVVKILDPDGATTDPDSALDSTPECLQP